MGTLLFNTTHYVMITYVRFYALFIHLIIDILHRDWKRITWAIHCYSPTLGPSSLELNSSSGPTMMEPANWC